MGIRDRDYMKRRADDEDDRASSLESKAEAIAGRILAKAGKGIMIFCIALGILAFVMWVISWFSGKH
ncbi:MAG TPA: hypothetical protein VH280_16765 [Verrucomicrobiae bacterium]|jgi:hypothetical protein|nr:hypothetical protein [Verrucomicrobiae bacterium]